MAALLHSRGQRRTILPIVSKSSIGSISLLSSKAAPIAISSKRGYGHQIGRFLPTSILPQTNKHVNNTESLMLRTAIQDLNKEEKNINSLEKMLETLRIARVLPTTNSTKSTSSQVVLPTKQQSDEQQQHTFQAMNRNARKAKRANHGKRPCSRIRRRYKVKKWANTSRRG